MRCRIICCVVGLFIFSFVTADLACAEPLLKWDASSGDVTGYRIYYGTSQGNHPDKVAIGNVTQYPLSSLPLSDNTTYHFTVKAYNAAGESGSSNEVSWSAGDNTPPLPPQGVTVE